MHRFHRFTIALLLTGLPLAAERAHAGASSERHAVLAAVGSLLEAMSRRDVATSRRLLISGAVFQSIRDSDTSGPLRVQGDSACLRWLAYDFNVNSAFSHCGVDSFTLLKTTRGWQVASIAYTVKRESCAPSPLGPLGSPPSP